MLRQQEEARRRIPKPPPPPKVPVMEEVLFDDDEDLEGLVIDTGMATVKVQSPALSLVVVSESYPYQIFTCSCRLVLQEMMHQGLCLQHLLEDQGTW